MRHLVRSSHLVQTLTLILVSAFVFITVYQPLGALEVTNRSMTMSSSLAAATASHEFEFDLMSVASIASLEFEYCSNSAFPGTPCTAPSGLDLTGAILSLQVGETGFSIHGSSTANRIVLTRTASVVIPGTVRYVFDNIINPNAVGAHYVRLGSFSSDDGTGARVDEGAVAISITDAIGVDAYVPPILLFCLGKDITGVNCGSATGSFSNLGELSSSSARSATTQMVAGTNASSGYTITVSGPTMTSGNKTISNLINPTASNPGTQQFGINFVANTIPTIGQNVSGSGSGVANVGYNSSNLYKYIPGDVVAYSPTSTETNKFTTSYIINVADNQPPGVYTTTITYIALASF